MSLRALSLARRVQPTVSRQTATITAAPLRATVTMYRTPGMMISRRGYAQWLFGYDGIADCLKPFPRSFWTRVAHNVSTLVLWGLLGRMVINYADSDYYRF